MPQAPASPSGPRRLGRNQVDMEIDSVVGSLTHRLVGQVLEDAACGSISRAGDLAGAIIGLGAELIAARPDLGPHAARVRMRVITAAGQYLQRYRPGGEVEFLGTEVPVRDGIVDIAWRHPQVGVFFDELKTNRRYHECLTPAAQEQLERYARSGAAEYGHRFYGVRYIPLLNPNAAVVAQAEGSAVTITPLSQTPLSFPYVITGGMG